MRISVEGFGFNETCTNDAVTAVLAVHPAPPPLLSWHGKAVLSGKRLPLRLCCFVLTLLLRKVQTILFRKAIPIPTLLPLLGLLPTLLDLLLIIGRVSLPWECRRLIWVFGVRCLVFGVFFAFGVFFFFLFPCVGSLVLFLAFGVLYLVFVRFRVLVPF